MAAQLFDPDGEFTLLGNGLRIASLAAASASLMAMIALMRFALLSPTMCGGGCTRGMALLAILLFASPLLLLVSTLYGFVAFKSPSWPTVLLALVPSSLVAAAFIAFSWS